MRKWLALTLVVALTAGTSFADAIGTSDVTPAATLLIPHFEVDTLHSNGLTTLVGIQNSSASSVVANVTIWTDYGIPTYSFPVYLTGYDTQTFDLYDVIVNGAPPLTADAGEDPGDNISPRGPISQDINFPGDAEMVTLANISAPQLTAALTGHASTQYLSGLCGAKDYGDGIARGYVTVDTMDEETYVNPTSPLYKVDFVNGGVLTGQNVLFGDYTFLDRANHRMTSDVAVHIEASFSSPETTVAGDYTFYGRFNGANASDFRESLPDAWGGIVTGGRTSVVYWRDPGVPVAPFTCGSGAPFTMTQTEVLGFDAEENPTTPAAANYFPLATGRVDIGPGGIPLTAKLGWLFLNLNETAASGSFGKIRQSWVSFSYLPEGVPATTPFETGWSGVQLGQTALSDSPTIPPVAP